ncbi:MAG TPA: hypothetical protein VFO59_09060 [Dehalococcoidia bacterium]|nr:hypothetical protein [Dehalococcoidia bacterium]
MPSSKLAWLAAGVASASVACSDSSPLAPAAAEPSLLSQPVPGSYDLDFQWNGVELILLAHVEDASSTPATGGAVVFQYCSYKGVPPNDITQPDEAPSSACADGSGTWATLARVGVNASGDAALNFGAISVVNVIGFRYRYIGQGSGIANAITDPEDWTR